MVTIKHIKAKKPPVEYGNPFEPINIMMADGTIIIGRPIEFDSEAVNDILNKDGKPIRPTRFQTGCPKCGVAIEVSEKETVNVRCPDCDRAIIETKIDPFINPVSAGLLSVSMEDFKMPEFPSE